MSKITKTAGNILHTGNRSEDINLYLLLAIILIWLFAIKGVKVLNKKSSDSNSKTSTNETKADDEISLLNHSGEASEFRVLNVQTQGRSYTL